MKFDDSFEVPASFDETWDALTDIERVYPCLPGAQLVEVKDNEFHGLVSLKLGPISANYKGTARFDELNREAGTLVILAEGRDKHGQGMAKARIEAALEETSPGNTRVSMVQEIDISGKAAQFGRGILKDVSKAMMGVFADNLRQVVTAPPAAQNGASAGTPASGGSATAGQTSQSAPPPPASAPINPMSVAKGVLTQKFQDEPLKTGLTLGIPVLLLLILRRAKKSH